jgi:hypothetical protein
MYKNDIKNLNEAFARIIEDTANLGPEGESQQGLSNVVQKVIKTPDEDCEGVKKGNSEECEGCGGTCGCESGNNEDSEMAKNELYNTVHHAVSIYNKLKNLPKLEPWVQSKITKAADYLNSVKHYLDHEGPSSQMSPLHSEENEEVSAIEDIFNTSSKDLLSKLHTVLSRESKENLEKLLYEVVKVIESKT